MILLCYSSAYADQVDMRCLNKTNGKCVSVNDLMVKNTVDILGKVPEEIGNMLFGKNEKENFPLQGNKSLKECMKGKKVIDNDVIRCRNGY